MSILDTPLERSTEKLEALDLIPTPELKTVGDVVSWLGEANHWLYISLTLSETGAERSLVERVLLDIVNLTHIAVNCLESGSVPEFRKTPMLDSEACLDGAIRLAQSENTGGDDGLRLRSITAMLDAVERARLEQAS